MSSAYCVACSALHGEDGLCLCARQTDLGDVKATFTFSVPPTLETIALLHSVLETLAKMSDNLVLMNDRLGQLEQALPKGGSRGHR